MDGSRGGVEGWSLALGGAKAYGLRVAASWAELLESFGAREKGGEALTPAVVWSDFKQQAVQSIRADVKRLVEMGEEMTSDDRVRFVAATIPLLIELDWPPAWEGPRRELMEALEALLVETDSQVTTTFAGALYSSLNESSENVVGPKDIVGLTFPTATLLLTIALNMLRTPCPPDEIREIALLCRMGTLALLGLATRNEFDKLDPALPDARTRYLTAFERYARAARAMNEAVGRVLFEGFDLGTQRTR